MTKEELAKWLHDNYEEIEKKQNWNTQQSCKVEFDNLPDANKRTMIDIADRLLNLWRLHSFAARRANGVGVYDSLCSFYTLWRSFDDKEPTVDNKTVIEVWTNYGARFAINKESGLQIFGFGKESEYKDMFEVTHWRRIEPPK